MTAVERRQLGMMLSLNNAKEQPSWLLRIWTMRIAGCGLLALVPKGLPCIVSEVAQLLLYLRILSVSYSSGILRQPYSLH